MGFMASCQLITSAVVLGDNNSLYKEISEDRKYIFNRAGYFYDDGLKINAKAEKLTIQRDLAISALNSVETQNANLREENRLLLRK